MKIKTLKWKKIPGHGRGRSITTLGYSVEVQGFFYCSLYKRADGRYESVGEEWNSKKVHETLLDGIAWAQARFETKAQAMLEKITE